MTLFLAGMGLNLSNKDPTTCINEQIEEYNKRNGKKLPPISYELYLALAFTELERLYNVVQSGGTDDFLQLYYRFWLHKYVIFAYEVLIVLIQERSVHCNFLR